MGSLVAACSSGSGSTGAQTAGPAVGWAESQAAAGNGTAPAIDVKTVCGSDTETYLTELLHVTPSAIKVFREWGDIVPGGKQVLVNGTVSMTHLGPTDLPMSHVFGDDLSMDVALDTPFLPFAAQLGRQRGDQAVNEIHVELSSGLLPHEVRTGVAGPDATWRQSSDHNLTGFLAGFAGPAIGDRVAVMGRWVIDCGHANYATELHPMSFLAWSHRDGNSTVVRVLMNPYRDAELYSPDAASLGRVNDAARLTAKSTKTFPQYLVDEVLRLASSPTGHLRSQELLEAVPASPVDWRVCAPAGTTGKTKVAADLVARDGVDVRFDEDAKAGCVTLQVTEGKGYRAADVKTAQCKLPWSYIRAVAGASVGSGVDIKSVIDKNVPLLLRPLVDRDPDTTCADALSGPPVHERPAARAVRTDNGQPFPLYGVVTVSRA